VIVAYGRCNDMRLSQDPAALTGITTRTLTRSHTMTTQATPAEMRVIERLVMVLLADD
jgi:hypothetical protein